MFNADEFRKAIYLARNYPTIIKDLEASLKVEREAVERLRELLRHHGYCVCEDPAQCWEPCGTLGHSEDHARVAS